MERLTEQIKNKETGEVLAYRLHTEVDRIRAYRKLGELEDAEEQGLLLRLPVPIWTEVHAISKCLAHNCEKCIAFGWNEHCFPEFHGKIYTHPMTYSDIPKLGKKVFLTKAEAEKALAEIG